MHACARMRTHAHACASIRACARAHLQVRIFVKFGKQAAAMKAYMDLDGRYFGGRHVWVAFFSENDFEAGLLAPSANDPK